MSFSYQLFINQSTGVNMLPPELRITLEDIFSDIQVHNRLSEKI